MSEDNSGYDSYLWTVAACNCFIISIIIRSHRSTTYYVDTTYCYRPSSVVCQSVTLVSLAKTGESMEMPFGLRTWVGPGDQIPHRKGHIFEGGRGVQL